MENRRNYIIGFLLLTSIHWTASILTAILTNVVGIFIAYEYVPWFGVLIIIAELFFIYNILHKDIFFNLNIKDLVKLTLTTVTLLILSQFDYLLEFKPGWCGNAIFDGTLDRIFETRNKNEFYSQIVERIILSVGIVYYVMKKLKTEPKNGYK